MNKKIKKYEWSKCQEPFKNIVNGDYCLKKCLFNINCSITQKPCFAVPKDTTPDISFLTAFNSTRDKLQNIKELFLDEQLSTDEWRSQSKNLLFCFVEKWKSTEYLKSPQYRKLAKEYSLFIKF